MESDLDDAELAICDVAAPPPHDNAERKESSRFTAPTSPLPPGYQLPFFAAFCYSPYGASPLAQQSRRLRDQVKRADRTTLARCAARVAAMAAAEMAPLFLNSDAALIPVPQCIPCDSRNPISAPVAITRALHAAGLGRRIWPALRRWRAVPKSAWSRPGSRPEFMDHYASLELLDNAPSTYQLLLVDDFVTRGRTLLAAAAVLAHALPRAHIRAFALVRTEGLAPDITSIITPTTGIIRYLGGDAFRTP
jgi:predicted amidophosphoribosyltransferase